MEDRLGSDPLTGSGRRGRALADLGDVGRAVLPLGLVEQGVAVLLGGLLGLLRPVPLGVLLGACGRLVLAARHAAQRAHSTGRPHAVPGGLGAVAAPGGREWQGVARSSTPRRTSSWTQRPSGTLTRARNWPAAAGST